MGFDRDAPQYPHVDGPHLILGPECFTGDGEEVPQDVIMWRGEAYTRVPPQGIDRDAVIADAMRMLYEHSPHPDREEAEELVDRMLLHGSYLTAAPDRDIIAAAIQTDFDVRSSAALRVADRILALAAEPELDARCSEGMLITEHTREAAPSQGIDRDALLVLLAEFGYDGAPDRAKLADAILALVRPVEGVTLTPEEKATVIDALRDISDMDERMAQIRPSRQREIDERRALAERLEKEAQ